ncbi:RING finger protein narya-like [Lucilia sericata]|uniref:RING finger protein narya-like n=1 Tax=Lucilia sericata TaxID=13632 RepID=UPI0018A86B55|nr:RING finger protein narya-like [Lucilia sericata]
MFPLYCNQCFRRQKYEISLQLFVSRCGHIICNNCAQENCCICGRPFKAVAINKEMPQSMAGYFSSPMSQYQHFKKTLKFHHEQQQRLVMHMCRTIAEEDKKTKSELEALGKVDDSIMLQIEHERERIRKLREYIEYHERRLEQARYMSPPISSQPRTRYQPRVLGMEAAMPKTSNKNVAKRFSQTIRPNLVFPQSPTISDTNNSSSVTTEETNVVKPITKKQRTPPALLPLSQHKLSDTEFSFNLLD